jgi:sigma-E factor negative regulatory protein RseC
MESEIGKVISTRPGYARVEVTQSSMCAHCELTSSCAHGTGGARTIEVFDPLGVSVDQQVRVELSSRELLAASFLAYIVPLITLFVGAALGFFLSGRSRNEFGVGMGAFCGLGAGLLLARLAGQWFGRRGKLRPTITAVVSGENRRECDHEGEDISR